MMFRVNCIAVVFGGALLMATVGAKAQQDLVGVYEGSYKAGTRSNSTRQGREMDVRVKLEILSVNGETVSGKWIQADGNCSGEFALAGSFKNGKLAVTTGEGPKPQCAGRKFQFNVDGGKLTGSVNKQEFMLSK